MREKADKNRNWDDDTVGSYCAGATPAGIMGEVATITFADHWHVHNQLLKRMLKRFWLQGPKPEREEGQACTVILSQSLV
jgi:hypothetical protein